jgi:hypothetical protein
MKSFALLIMVVLLMFACVCSDTVDKPDTAAGEQPPPHVTVEVKDGVTYVHNKRIPFSDIKLESELVLGEDDNDLYFGRNPIVKEGYDGNIYIADNSIRSIYKLDYEGKLLNTFGGKGQGPGEFTSITTMNFFTDNQIHIFDRTMNRSQIFNSNGKLLEHKRLGELQDASSPRSEFAISNDIIYEKNIRGFFKNEGEPANENNPLYSVRKMDSSYNVLGYLIERDSSRIHVYRKPIIINLDSGIRFSGFGIPPKHYNEAYWIMRLNEVGTLYKLNIYDNTIEVYKSDTLSMCISRELAPHYQKLLEEKGKAIPNEDADVDEMGNLYVLTMLTGPPTERSEKNLPHICLEVFNSKGWLIYSIVFNETLPRNIHIGKDNKIYVNDYYTYTATRYKALVDQGSNIINR